ncbi:hypothetical protein ACCO45_008931 [Purpureocillium lilacinum]|uniref:Uncharacterized protein n=1 Tax=Purpureocillium lilacinum TaxID=33203 RepID=A0ACC4DI72_PURLI
MHVAEHLQLSTGLDQTDACHVHRRTNVPRQDSVITRTPVIKLHTDRVIRDKLLLPSPLGSARPGPADSGCAECKDPRFNSRPSPCPRQVGIKQAPLLEDPPLTCWPPHPWAGHTLLDGEARRAVRSGGLGMRGSPARPGAGTHLASAGSASAVAWQLGSARWSSNGARSIVIRTPYRASTS